MPMDIKNKDFGKNGVYHLLSLIAIVFLLGKILLFYNYMGVSVYLAPVTATTLFFIWLLFSLFKNKWIPIGIYFVISLLMFADVLYSAFFNRYLSVGMLGAAGMVGAITDSIMEVLRPGFFLMFLDVLVFIIIYSIRLKYFGKDIKKNRLGKIRLIGLIPVLLLVFFSITNPLESNFFKSLSNQEIVIYHIKDIAYGLEDKSEYGQLTAYTDSYLYEKKGPNFADAEGRNIIIIQLESFQNFVINMEYEGQEITPRLNGLLGENTTYFPNFFQQIGSGNTSDAEYAVNNSLMGSLESYTYKLFQDNYFRGLPQLLKEKGYETAVLHAFEDRFFWNRENIYPQMGFDKFYGGLNDQGRNGDFTPSIWMGWGLVDSEFYLQAMDYIKGLKEPFYSFVISLSNHHPFEMLNEFQFIKLKDQDRGTMLGNYLNSVAYTDYSIGIFLDKLKEAGLYDKSIIVIYGDHMGLVHSDETDKGMEEIFGRPYAYEDMLNVPLLIHIPSSDGELPKRVETVSGQTDVLPTLAYLLGWNELDTLYTGHNIYTVKNGFVAQQTYMPKGSFISDDIVFVMSKDGVFNHGTGYDFKTKEKVDLASCKKGYLKSLSIINTGESILKSNAIKQRQ